MLALVTGASGGIGQAIARELALRGYDLILVARSEDKMRALVEEGYFENANCEVIRADLSQTKEIEALYQRCQSLSLEPDILINNAGFGQTGAFTEIALERQLSMIDLNIRALTHLTHLFLPAMLAKEKGYLLNVASIAAFIPGPWMNVYYASKSYVLSFSEALREECAGKGVVVSCLCPGPTPSGFQKEASFAVEKVSSERMLTSVEEVAQKAVMDLFKDRAVIVPGIWNALFTKLVPRLPLPRTLVTKLSGVISKRGGEKR